MMRTVAIDCPLVTDENLALRPHVRVTVSVTQPTGGGARDPRVLLDNEVIQPLEGVPLSQIQQLRTYDTYDGQNQAHDFDWYTLEWQEATSFNCIAMTMGFACRDGGWWRSLAIEVLVEPGTGWQRIEHFSSTPAYNFSDARGERRPFETHVLTFDVVTALAVRVLGQPGGLAQFTSLARLAVYQRDLSHWNPASMPDPPVPRILRLFVPATMWDLSESLAKLTGLAIEFPLMEYYLDEQRYERFWRRLSRNYQGQPELWFLVGDTIGWNQWDLSTATATFDHGGLPPEPCIRRSFHNTLARAVAPVVIEGEVIGEMTTNFVVLKELLDWGRHRRYAEEHAIPWPVYLAAIERSPHMSAEQLEGAATLLGMIANTIANLVNRNAHLEHELARINGRSHQRKELTHQAIAFMQENLELPIDVADVAQAVALSPSHFYSLFTEQTGHTPSAFLIELRLERAKEYLSHTAMSVMEISDALGYDPSYFSRLFKRRTGCTPGEFARKMHS